MDIKRSKFRKLNIKVKKMISAEQADDLMGESVNDLVDMICTMSGYIDDLEETIKKLQAEIKELKEKDVN